MERKYDFGLIGLGVMGRNFMLNVADKGFSVIGHDQDMDKVNSLKHHGRDPNKAYATTDMTAFTSALRSPRRIMLFVPAGKVVDALIEALLPFLNEGDMILDGGNSFFKDTDRRQTYLSGKGIYFFGVGVSGGAKGARYGPSIMPGGNKEAYMHIKPILEAAAATYKGSPCVAYLGPSSSGSYVKMAHNGIEYGLMQLIAEIYDLLKKGGALPNAQMHQVFAQWNKGRLNSFLVGITAKVLAKKDDLSGGDLIDHILDRAKQKGTGKWTSQNALDLGVPLPTIDAAVSMRQLSAFWEIRSRAGALYHMPPTVTMEKDVLIATAEKALYFSFIMTFAQGMHLLYAASKAYGYALNLAEIARIWCGGCIIRAVLLEDIAKVFGMDPGLPNLVMADHFVSPIKETLGATRTLVAYAAAQGMPLPGFGSALNYFYALTATALPMNLIQAQRDFFGSHTYERRDRDGIFHSQWEE